MDYEELLNFATALGYRLQMAGAEIYRVEESVRRVLTAYGVPTGEVFAIPNCLTASIATPGRHPLTRIRRVGFHGTDIYRLERLNELSRRICADPPPLEEAWQQLRAITADTTSYSFPLQLLFHAAAAFSFAFFFGGGLPEACCAAFSGLSIGLIVTFMEKLNTNPFFKTCVGGFFSALVALILVGIGIPANPDIIIIAALMDLVPGIAFTNAIRDVIAGDMVSGISKIAEALLIGVAIALGTGLSLVLARFLGVAA